MVSLGVLWLPIVLSAVLVFVLSSIIHMVLRYHNADYTRLPNEDAVREAIRSGNPAPKQYIIPYCASPKEMESPEMKRKFAEGPIGVLNLKPTGSYGMGANLVQWFLFALLVSLLVAYVARHALPPGAPYLEVLRFAGCVAFVGYSLALWEMLIWYKRAWGTTIRSTIDGLIYGLLTGCTLGYFWPK